MQFLDYGERAFFCEDGYLGMSPRLEATLDSASQYGLQEWVSGYDKLLLICDTPKSVEPLKDYLRQHADAFDAVESLTAAVIEVPVRYQGPDLERVARQLDLSTHELVALHVAVEYRVHTMGFMPGFPYLSGLDPRLHLKRMASPRNYVPAGSVAIGGRMPGFILSPAPVAGISWGKPIFLYSIETLLAGQPVKRAKFLRSMWAIGYALFPLVSNLCDLVFK